MKNYILILLILSIGGCKITHFSSGGTLKNGLKNNISSFFQEKSTEIAQTYQKYDSIPPDTVLISQIRKFDKGFYVVKMREVEKNFSNETEKIEYAGKVKIEEKDTTTLGKLKLTRYEVNNKLDLSYSDKLVYIIFLDNERVLFHSPYRKNFLKTGEVERVNIENTPKRNAQGIVKKQVKFMRKTDTYFKLGEINYDYNSVMKGYYKIKEDSIFMWFEKGLKNGKIKLLRMDFTFKIENRWKSVETLDFISAMIDNQKVEIKKVFNDSISFDYQAQPFRLLFVSDKIPKKPMMEKLIIEKIEHEGNQRKYYYRQKINDNKKEQFFYEPVNADSIYTF